uniref:Uncharacterized protein n=1 Tax=Timema poppense TaxID=170557 RepID=A0A7R9DNW8_TIMPO|nr:unnamed protein product [Timema poppensis]
MDYEEFTALVLDKLSDCEPKTAEELRRHSVDAHIDRKPIERALHILTVGEEGCTADNYDAQVQKLSVIESLPFLLKTHGIQNVQRVVNRVMQVLPTSSVENHFAASSVFQEVRFFLL